MPGYTSDDLIDLLPEWYEVFPDHEIKMGFEITGDQVPILKDCIRTKSLKPLMDYLKALPKDTVY